MSSADFKSFDHEALMNIALTVIHDLGVWLPHAAITAEFERLKKIASTDEEFLSLCTDYMKTMLGKWREPT